nr:MAG TPA: hypothetical protein [Podoviridae sp. ctJ6o53]
MIIFIASLVIRFFFITYSFLLRLYFLAYFVSKGSSTPVRCE